MTKKKMSIKEGEQESAINDFRQEGSERRNVGLLKYGKVN